MSAVTGIIPVELACGIGGLTKPLAMLMLTSVLDLLYLRYTLRDLVCLVRVFTYSYPLALVGGRYDNGTNAGLWYWNVNNASSNLSVNIGARPLIFIIKITYTSFSSALAEN